MWSMLVFLIILLIPFAESLNEPPQVECLEDAMRIHFTPDFLANTTNAEAAKFCGHVYVKSFFFSSRCHLDFTRIPVDQPFYFHIPYKSDCQVRRERLTNQSLPNDAAGGTGFLYSTVILVQHHRLFVTNRDRAYSVSCFYNENRNFFQNRLQVGELMPSQVEGVDRVPSCVYEILSASTGRPTRFANIGDQLVYRWSCDAENMGMLVHSCFVRDDIGSEFALLNERGCVTDESIMEPLIYSTSLNETHSPPVGAFKFADQMTVYFTCRITLCDRRENGCEGITPPTCNLTAPPTSSTSSLQLLGGRRGPLGIAEFPPIPPAIEPNNMRRTFAVKHDDGSNAFRKNVNHVGDTTPAYVFQLHPPTVSAQGSISDEWALNAVNLFSRGRLPVSTNWTATRRRRRDSPALFVRTTKVRREWDPRTVPPNETTPLARPRMTVDVMADRLIIFTNDEKISSDTQVNETLLGKRPPARHCGDVAVLWMSAVFAVLLTTSVCTFVVLHMRFRRKMFALRRQLQSSMVTAGPRGALPGYGSFAPPPFFELATMMQAQERGAQSRQNLIG